MRTCGRPRNALLWWLFRAPKHVECLNAYILDFSTVVRSTRCGHYCMRVCLRDAPAHLAHLSNPNASAAVPLLPRILFSAFADLRSSSSSWVPGMCICIIMGPRHVHVYQHSPVQLSSSLAAAKQKEGHWRLSLVGGMYSTRAVPDHFDSGEANAMTARGGLNQDLLEKHLDTSLPALYRESTLSATGSQREGVAGEWRGRELWRTPSTQAGE